MFNDFVDLFVFCTFCVCNLATAWRKNSINFSSRYLFRNKKIKNKINQQKTSTRTHTNILGVKNGQLGVHAFVCTVFGDASLQQRNHVLKRASTLHTDQCEYTHTHMLMNVKSEWSLTS